MKISGIYRIQSKVKPDRCYVGSAINIPRRWNNHLSRLRNNYHHSKKLQRHFNKYGESDLDFSILLGCDKEDLMKTEQYFIDSYKPYFNSCMVAGNTKGLVCREETKKKISLKNKGKKRSLEMRIRLSVAKSGKRVGGVLKHSEETRAKMSNSHKSKEHYLKGKHLPLETKIKISLAHKGKIVTEETRKRMRESHLGLKHTEESKAKMRTNKKLRVA